MEKYALPVLRYGLALVFTWFAVTQLKDPIPWSGLIPDWITNISGLEAVTMVRINAISEIILAVLLAIGIRIRIVSALLGLHLLSIVSILGLDPNGIRDIGLFFGMLAIFLNGADSLCFDPTQKTKGGEIAG